MTQKCKHDEQLLDYVYGELSDAERKIFADHLATCSTCPAQVESFGGIRKEFQQRSPIEPAGEAMQRMTALLMQAAAVEHGATASAAAEGGGKVLAFRSRGLRRILFHPAGGVMAVAAAALFWVVFRAQPVPPTGLSAPTAATALEAPRGMEQAAAPVAALMPADPAAMEKNALKQAPSAAVAVPVDSKPAESVRAGLAAGKGSSLAKDGDFDGLRARSRDVGENTLVASGEQKLAARSQQHMVALKTAEPSAPPAKPTMMAQLDKSPPATRAVTGKPSAPPYRSAGPAVVAMADQAYQRSAKKESGYESPRPADSWSQPPAAEPPPPPVAAAPRPLSDEEPASVSANMARTQERRKQKVVEELANQELGGLAASSAGGAATGAQANDNRYAQRSPGSGGNADTGAVGNQGMLNQADDTPTPVATPVMPATSASRGAVGGSAADDGAAALAAVKEQLRRGQCTEANASLTRLERTLPMLHGLAETRAEWQSACATPSQQLLDRRMQNEAEAPAPPMAAPYRMSKSRMASPAPMPAKAAKPRPSERSKAKADTLQ